MDDPLPATDPPARRWARRALTFPGYGLAVVGLIALAPILLPLAAVFDLARGSGLASTRLLLFALYYLACEWLGLAASLGLWLAQLVRPDRERFLRRHYALQDLWAGLLFGGVRRLFGIRLEVEGAEDPPARPLLVFIRHASVVDTLLPALVVSRRYGLRLRYVLKRELLRDPCLDVVGNRLPNVFVRRNSPDSAIEIERVMRLAAGLRAGEGVLIYPEGTRYTPARRQRALARIERTGNARRLAAARRMRHVLPPRTGGPMALLESCPEADVLLVAHVGLEGASHLRQVVRGSLNDRVVRVHLLRVPRSSIPGDRDKQIDWLYEAWERIDAWIDAQSGGGRVPDRPEGSERSGACIPDRVR